jgi:two-component system phosphate regulon sensor histidine kinase PhoR
MDNLYSSTYIKGSSGSIGPEGVSILREKIWYKFSVDSASWHESKYWRKLQYDICDTTQWTSEAVDSLFNLFIQEKYNIPIARTFTMAEQSGEVMNQLNHGHLSLLFRVHGDPILLGYIHPRVLSSEFSYPVLLFWRNAWFRIVFFGLFFVFLCYCIWILYKQLRNEIKASKYRDHFTSALVHNQRGPISKTKMLLDELESHVRTRLSADEHNLILRLSENLVSMYENTSRLLTLFIDEHGLLPVCECVSIEPFLDALAEKYTLNTEQKSVAVSVHVNPGNLQVYMDPFHFGNALENLIENAVKYCGKAVSIDLGCYQKGRLVIFSILDNGPGISLKDQKIVFERFRKGVQKDARARSDGFGLGLSYVKTVVLAHKGRVRIKSDGKNGTEFIISIPFYE